MIFSSAMRRMDYDDVKGSLALMENHIRSMQEQLEYTLYNLDSSNVRSLDTGVTDIASGDGGINIKGESVLLAGPQGEKVHMGREGGSFVFEVCGKGGRPGLYMDGSGRIALSSEASVTIDCGTWS